MCIGLKRTMVVLEEHCAEWERLAAQTISELKRILGDLAIDVQHVGSTSIRGIAAKPIIDIAIGAKDIAQVLSKNQELEENGIIYRGEDVPGQALYVIGDFQNETRTHHIHVVTYGSTAWNNYINFRDYLNFDHEMAKQYSELKKTLGKQYASNRGKYTEGKRDLIDRILAIAANWKQSQS